MSGALSFLKLTAMLTVGEMAGAALVAALAIVGGWLVRVARHWNADELHDAGRPAPRSLAEWQAEARRSNARSRERRDHFGQR